ncbi:vitamin K epoxide reductase family protein [Nostocaceae cyanobacterium CENA369]|uniref:Vitamin K epoxide reductase family protein n=1 Tax=Dendronalium phyllosphericum CENA369 TaxID=1725256 RepID=A0A8J7IKG3_9NOST|nr:vitamin K epoxide reductase family protein [Dendronalium phyllosphericum]MBH8576392.1 vitamin K epoxide reductase family protein [Dendronalium phyllosphericum CENA369]
MIRRRSTPWIHKWSRPLIAAIAGLGALTTGYLAIEKLTGGSAACVAQAGVKGCNDVLSSPWAIVLGQPLALFGFLAYTGMVIFALAPLVLKSGANNTNKQLENWTWWLLLVGAIAMSVFSGYLMYLLVFQLKALCPYCIGSALFSLSLLVLTIVGREWEDVGQIFFTAIIVGMVTLIGTLGIYSGVNQSGVTPGTSGKPEEISFVPQTNPNPEFGWEITTTSGQAEIELARHLVKIGAKEYVAYWCPHCHEQKLLFGKEAYQIIESVKVECAGDSPKGKPDLCKAANIQSFPTWIINGQSYSGVQNLAELAKISGYTGSTSFKYFK